jgi:YebC/PmpR family DNA-binding regulatory protein
MSGHSKWSTIKRKKGAEDAKRGKIFTRITREITLAARAGGGDSATNSALRLAVDKAKAANMPKDNIERAIKKGTGELEGGELEEVTYEAYAPHGVAVLIQCVTDNRNRALADVRRVFNKQGGNMAEQGAVNWMFDTRGYITVPNNAVDQDEVFMVAVDAGAEDVEFSDEVIEIYTLPGSLHAIRESLQDADIPVDETELSKFAKAEIELEVKETLSIMNLIELLEDLDDVDKVYSNLNISDAALAQLAGA